MSGTRKLLCLVVVILFQINISCASNGPGSFIWTGFDHQWSRNLDTSPHSLLSIGSFFGNVTTSGKTTRGTAYITFEPPPAGDYAFPQLHYTTMLNPSVVWATVTYQTSFTDNATEVYPGYFSATTNLSFQVPISIEQFRNFDNYDAFMQGFHLDLFCDSSLQNCTSEGIWPYDFALEIPGCTRFNESFLNCELDVTISRTSNPTATNIIKYISYSLTIIFGVLGGNNGYFSSTRANIPTSIMTTTSRPPAQGSGNLIGNQSYGDATTGITGFSFQIQDSAGMPSGQDLQRLTFMISDINYDGMRGDMRFGFSMGYRSHPTQPVSKIALSISPILLQFSSTAMIERGGMSYGSVCGNGQGFSCQGLNIPQRASVEAEMSADFTR